MAAGFVGSLATASSAQLGTCMDDIESLMRDLQSRYFEVSIGATTGTSGLPLTSNVLDWPPCCPSEKAPAFPPDDYYDSSLKDPNFAVELLKALRAAICNDVSQFSSTPRIEIARWYAGVEETPAGPQPNDGVLSWADPSNRFPFCDAEITPDNLCERYNALRSWYDAEVRPRKTIRLPDCSVSGTQSYQYTTSYCHDASVGDGGNYECNQPQSVPLDCQPLQAEYVNGRALSVSKLNCLWVAESQAVIPQTSTFSCDATFESYFYFFEHHTDRNADVWRSERGRASGTFTVNWRDISGPRSTHFKVDKKTDATYVDSPVRPRTGPNNEFLIPGLPINSCEFNAQPTGWFSYPLAHVGSEQGYGKSKNTFGLDLNPGGTDTMKLFLGEGTFPSHDCIVGGVFDDREFGTRGWQLMDFANLVIPKLNDDPEEGRGCGEDCSTCPPTDPRALLGSVDVSFPLGRTGSDRSAGYLGLRVKSIGTRADDPTLPEVVVKPNRLVRNVQDIDTFSSTIDPATGTIGDYTLQTSRTKIEVEYTGQRDQNSSPVLPYQTTISLSERPVSANGDLGSDWVQQARFVITQSSIGAPNNRTDTISVQKFQGTVLIKTWEYEGVGENWTLKEAQSTAQARSQRETITLNSQGDLRTTVREIVNSANVAVSKSTTVEQLFAWGWEVVQESQGNDLPLVRTFGTTQGQPSYRRVTSETTPTGHWRKYQYDADGNVSRIVTQFKSNSITSADALNRVDEFETTYGFWDRQPPATGKNTLIEHRSFVQGVQVGRTLDLWCPPTPNQNPPQGTIAHSAPWHLTIRSANLSIAAGALVNSLLPNHVWLTDPSSQDDVTLVAADGNYSAAEWDWRKPTMATYRSDGTASETTRTGQGDNVESIYAYSGLAKLVNGNLEVEYLSERHALRRVDLGLTKSETTRDREHPNQPITNHMEVVNFDDRGRATRIEYRTSNAPGSPAYRIEETTYGCCGVESSTGADGITSTTSYDALKRPEISRSKVSPTEWLGTRSVYDAAGRVVQTFQRYEGTAVQERSRGTTTYDTAGRVLSSTDAVGNVTTYSEDVVTIGATPYVRQVQVLPAPSAGEPSPTVVTLSYQDGSHFKTEGTGARTQVSDYGVDPATGQQWTKQTVGAAGTQWTKSYTDALGRHVRTTYAPNETAQESVLYAHQNRMTTSIDADGVRSISARGRGVVQAQAMFGSNLPSQLIAAQVFEGDWSVSVLDRDADGIDWSGPDQVSVSRSFLAQSGSDYYQYSKSYVLKEPAPGQNDFSVLELSETVTTLDGMTTWSTANGQTSQAITGIDRTNAATVTYSVVPTGAWNESITSYGRQTYSFGYHADESYAGGSYLIYDMWGRTIESHFLRTDGAALNSVDDDVTEMQYDALDRVTQRKDPAADPVNAPTARRTVATSYDNLGRTTAVTNVSPNGPSSNTVTTYTYWPTGEVKTVRGFGVNPVDYVYDDAGRMVQLITYQNVSDPATAATTTWAYNPARGWLDAKIYADSHGMAYQYTPAGRLSIRTNARDISTTYSYGSAAQGNMGALSFINYSDDSTPDVSLTYDRRGRAKLIVDAAGTRTITYTEDGRPVDEFIEAGTGPIKHLAGVSTHSTYEPIAGTPFSHLRNRHDVKLNTLLKSSVLFEHDADQRLARVYKSNTGGTLAAGADVAYTFDPLSGQVTSSTSRRQVSGSGLAGTFDDETSMVGTRSYDRLGRLTNISWMLNSPNQPRAASSDSYAYDWLGRRNGRVTGPGDDSESWQYDYDSLNQLVQASAEFVPTGGPWNGKIPGSLYEYDFDHIGNRESTTMGTDGGVSYQNTYALNSNGLNQYASRTVSGNLEITGHSDAPIVQVWTDQETPSPATEAQRHMPADGFFHRRVTFNNTVYPVAGSVNAQAVPGSFTTYDIFLPKTPEDFTYDLDGNLASDGLWNYEWDAENRLVAMQLKPALAPIFLEQGSPYLRVEFAYDYMNRRISKKLLTSNTGPVIKKGETIIQWQTGYQHFYVYDGPGNWNLSAILSDGSDPANGTPDAVEQTFAWGPDLSSTEQGAGGIGGLAVMLDDSFELGGGSGAVGHMFPVYDGNGNVVKVYSTEIQQDLMTNVAEYRYGPFGEQRGQSGSMATRLPFRWSTKFTDNETALVYYGYRYYSGSLGRWVSRDPLAEVFSCNLVSYVDQSPLNKFDYLGLWPGLLWFIYNNQHNTIPPAFKVFEFNNRVCRGVVSVEHYRLESQDESVGADILMFPVLDSNKPQECLTCKLDDFLWIQVVHYNQDIPAGTRSSSRKIEAGIKPMQAFVDTNDLNLPYYGDQGEWFSDRPFSARSLFPKSTDGLSRSFAASFEACLVCRKSGRTDYLMGCVSWGYLTYPIINGVGSARGDQLQSLSWDARPTERWQSTVRREFPRYKYEIAN